MDLSELRQAIEAYATSNRHLKYDNLQVAIDDVLNELANRGELALGLDHQLSGRALEIRVRLVLAEMGFDVKSGRPGHEDFTVSPVEDIKPQKPLVIEVKSSRKPQIDRSDLRQLDDWVFDLSGEEKARKVGLGGGPDGLAISTWGNFTSRVRHPNPHKGVLIFNGSLGIPFDERQSSAVGANDEEFAKKRDFCVIPLPVLLQYSRRIRSGVLDKTDFWNEVHNTCGVLDYPKPQTDGQQYQ